jgi:hypothetical protein
MTSARVTPINEKSDVWTKLAAPLPLGVISWRQDGKVTARDGSTSRGSSRISKPTRFASVSTALCQVSGT